ncbi:MAG: ABC transporter ATP-binding protein [Spirochaetales bacterium]|nr:ABC transporter ATP-binding protein [Spirochaetales bacterium]
MSSETVLEVKDLVVEYRTRHATMQAVNGISLSIGKGETLGLVGETGAGKTTTALAIMGLLPVPPSKIVRGSIRLGDVDILNSKERELEKVRGRDVSMIFQDPMSSLNPVMTVEEQIMDVYIKHQRLSKEEARKMAHKMLEVVGVAASRGVDYPHQFSGGMKQRVVIAMALACNPKLLIADEPTTALDVTIQAQILEKIGQIKKQFGSSLLMITHDLGIIAETCDKVSVIYCGRVVEHGTLEDVFDHTSHPYTKGLFDSLPNGASRKTKLNPIGGMLPNPAELPKGCNFCPRCKYADERCRKEKPQPVCLGGEHYVECHLFSAGGDR